MKKESKQLKNVAQVLQGLFENGKHPIAVGFQRYRLEQNWSEVIGKEIGQYSRPVDFQNGLLVIAVTNPSLLTELQFFRQTITKKVNKYVGTNWVKSVRFVSE